MSNDGGLLKISISMYPSRVGQGLDPAAVKVKTAEASLCPTFDKTICSDI